MGAGIGPGRGSRLNSSTGKREWGSMTSDQIPMTNQIPRTNDQSGIGIWIFNGVWGLVIGRLGEF